MAVDLSVFGRLKTKADYDQAEQEFQIKKLLTQSEIAKNTQFDVDKLGEQAFFKAAQGQPLSNAELAAAKYVDAKSGGIQFDPVTGAMVQKPRISDKIGLPGITPPGNSTPVNNTIPGAVDIGGGLMPPKLPIGNLSPVIDGQQDAPNDFDIQFQKQYAGARGNPKLQQQLMQEYNASKIKSTEDQSKSTGFADRMTNDLPIFEDPNVLKAMSSPLQRSLGSVPLVGNYLVNDDYQRGDQARRDFTNAQLRRESGAAINQDEKSDARAQYLPQPGDSDAVLQQKATNRTTALGAMQYAAGPGYKIKQPKIDPSKIPMAAAQYLVQNPQTRDAFDVKYGKGASNLVLMNGK